MKRLTLKYIGEEHLSLSDSRSVMNWLKRNKVAPFKDGKSWYVWEVDFFTAFAKTQENVILGAPSLKREAYKPTSSHAIAFARKYGKAA